MAYKVLIIDDQHHQAPLEEIKKLAKLFKIDLVGERFHVKGIEKLKNDVAFEYQAVILDATGFKKSDIEEDNQTNRGLYYSLKELSEHKAKRLIPWFVYTGAPRNLDNEDFIDKIAEYQTEIKFGRKELCYYTKTEDERELLEDIIFEIEKISTTQIEYKYREVLMDCKKIGVGSELIGNLIQILKSTQSNNLDLEPSLYFTQLRMILEYVFRDAAKLNILHERCITDGRVNLTESSLFLAGERTKYLNVSCSKAHFSKIMADNIKNLIFITGAASHTSDVNPAENRDYQDYHRQVNTPYLLYQLVYILCDLLIWYDAYSEKNNDINKNKSLWVEGPLTSSVENHEPFTGALKKDTNGNYHVGHALMPYSKVEGNFMIGDMFEITKTIVNDKSTKNIYPYFVTHFKKI
ncbi:hypothetical protein EGI26_08495 [Lacihabitans sp. CCS-44]|uniref:hypothetical protein n=1 Tax=Lacihabitans sp. CCS-44 TaxID=2487331 RepID=UPI0020CEE65C|nr:hypothetical protein [Lacihabitans sp. CCS-44]MCP9755190.1 hypothetical protein [Lacihabitans sp. CCS-44]